MKKTKFKLIIIFLIVTIIEIVMFNPNSYAGYSFEETTYDIDNLGTEIVSTSNNFLNSLLGFNSIYIPYILIIFYILIQILLVKKYKKNKLSKNLEVCLKIDIIVILSICLINAIIGDYVIGYITIQNSFLFAEITNIILNALILIVGLIFSRKLLKESTDKNKKLCNKMMLIMVIMLIIIRLALNIFIVNEPTMHVVERDWGFGETFDIRRYDIKIYKDKNIGNTSFLVKEIDDEGVLIEYERAYYELNSDSTSTDYIYQTEIVQQKMKWNVNYSYESEKHPMLAVDGGTNYYVRFEK